MNESTQDNRIREAFEQNPLSEEAKDRMYQNILRKAEEAKSNNSAEFNTGEMPEIGENQTKFEEVYVEHGRSVRKKTAWRKYASIAACLVIFIGAGLAIPKVMDSNQADPTSPQDGAYSSDYGDSSDSGEDLVVVGSPFIDVESAADFESELGFAIDAPDDAENATYCIAYENTEIVNFTWQGHSYDYTAYRIGQTDVYELSSGDGIRMQTWDDGEFCFALGNSDGASEADFDELKQILAITASWG